MHTDGPAAVPSSGPVDEAATFSGKPHFQGVFMIRQPTSTSLLRYLAGPGRKNRGTPAGRPPRKSLLQIVFCLLFVSVIPACLPLDAQTFYASLSGVVTDPSGAVVSGAAVTVVEVTTSAAYKTTTNHQGSYRVSFLKPGEYIVHVQKAGFEEYKTATIPLVLNQEAVVDATLQVGSESEAITVNAQGTALNDTNPQIGNQFGSNDLINLPENISTHGAEELLLSAQVPGVSSTSPDYSNPNNISLGGGRPDTNPIIVDGLPSNMGVDDTYGLVPTPDSTEELQVLTSPFSAQYGQSGGGAVLTTTKSGTENFHGSAFESYSSQDLNALGYFTAPGTVVQPSYFHYFGGSVGGPVWIPKLFDGRKYRLYFFTDWEDTLTHADTTFNAVVPTTAELNGDFSGPSPEGGGPTATIYDPLSTQIVNGKPVRTPFPGNVIPRSRLDSVGVNIASFFPQPNCNFNNANYCVNPISKSSYLYNASRVDYNYSDYDHIWAKFSRDGPTNQPTIDIPNAANTSALNGWVDDNYEVSWSHIFSPRVSNEARVGYVSEENFSS